MTTVTGGFELVYVAGEPMRWRALGGLTPLAVALPLALASAPLPADSSPYTAGHALLVEALAGQRPFEPRLTGGFRYAPVRRHGANPVEVGTPSFATFVRAAALIEREHEESPRPQSAAALGLLRLHQSRIDEALALLDQAYEGDSLDPRIPADLAAARFERGVRDQRMTDFAAALRLADLVVARVELPEARFTRALALSRLGLRGEALAAWSTVIAGAEHGWSGEASRRAHELQGPTAMDAWKAELAALRLAIYRGDTSRIVAAAERFPQQVRSEAEDVWLGEWADAVDGGQQNAAVMLNGLQAVARAQASVSGDRLLASSTDALAEASANAAAGDRAKLQLLVRAHRIYRDARALQEEERYSQSRPLLREAAALFVEAGSPFAAWAKYREAVAVYHLPDHRRALELFAALGTETARPGRRVLAGHVAWMVGLTRFRLGEWTAALEEFETAEEAFAASREVENRAAIRSLRIWPLQVLGRDDDVDREQTAVLEELPWIVKPRRLVNILSTALETLRERGEDSTALYFRDEVLRLAKASGNPNWIARAFLQRAELLERAHLADRAENDLNQALRYAEQTPEAGERLNIEAGSLRMRARLAARRQPERARELLDRATALVREHEIQFLLLPLLSDRASVEMAAGDFAAAETYLEQGLSELERQLVEGASRDDEGALLEEGRRLFDMLVRLDVDRGGMPSAGRAAAERSRLRGLDQDGSGREHGFAGPTVTVLAQDVPRGTAILELFSLPDRLYTWLVLPHRVVFRHAEISSPALAQLIGDFVRVVRADEPAAAEAYGKRLSALLFDSFHAELDGISSLVVVPDRALWSLPFAALPLADGSYLVERYDLTIAASASRYMTAGGSPEPTVAGRGVLLVGGASAADDHGAALPGVENELRALAAIHAGATVLRGGEATLQQVRAELTRHELFHFAGHAREAPPALVLQGGLLTVADLPRSADGRPALAVLAGCRSASGNISGARGARSLARGFLDRGVRHVIASLWDVEDEVARRFSVNLHAALHRGEAPARALRSAQEELLRAGDAALSRPASWSTYQLLAGGTSGEASGRSQE